MILCSYHKKPNTFWCGRLILFLLISLLGFNLTAQYNVYGARAAGFGNSSVSLQGINAVFTNQAGLTSVEKLSALAFVGQRYFISELKDFRFGAALPTRSGTFGISAGQFGMEEFKQQKIGFSYARRMLENLSFGAQFDYVNLRIAEYGSRGVLTFEAGLLIQISRQLMAGTHLFSPAKVELAKGESLPTIYRFGFSYLPSEKVVLSLELEKEISFPLRFKSGFEYRAASSIYLRGGINISPNVATMGLGYTLKSGIRIDIATQYHQIIGFSPVAGISFER